MKKFMIVIFLLSCSKESILKKIEKGDIKIYKKLYPFQTYEIRGQKFENLVKKLRMKISENPQLFDYVTERFYNLSNLKFSFRVSKMDTLRNILLLRYFAPVKGRIFAGIIMEFIFSLKGELKEIYVYKIPLER